MKYIDAERLKAEVEKRMHICDGVYERDSNTYYQGKAVAYQETLSFIESLEKPLPVEEQKWDDSDMREDENELLSRFAFYTYKDEPTVLYLSNVFVEESFRNIGIGTKILRAAEKVAETISAISIRLKVKQNSPANAWYRKNGYGYMAFEGDYDWLEKNLEYMKPNTLSVKELKADLEKEVKSYIKDNFTITDEVAQIPEQDRMYSMGEGDMRAFARHFAEWGAIHLNARKED